MYIPSGIEKLSLFLLPQFLFSFWLLGDCWDREPDVHPAVHQADLQEDQATPRAHWTNCKYRLLKPQILIYIYLVYSQSMYVCMCTYIHICIINFSYFFICSLSNYRNYKTQLLFLSFFQTGKIEIKPISKLYTGIITCEVCTLEFGKE